MPQHFAEVNSSRSVYLTAVLFLLVIAVGEAGAQTWQAQPSGTGEVLLGVSFTDVNHGYAVGTNGAIRITANGGSSWSPQASGTSRFLRDVYFSDATHGTIVGESGLILRTTDGTTWNPQTSNTLQHLVHVHFVNNNVGMATGQGGVILKTTDGGGTWTPQNSGTSVELPCVVMLDENTAVAVGFGGTIRRTTNGGSSWESITVPGFGSDLRSVHFFGSTGVAVSIGGGILKSTNRGASWTNVSSGTASDLYAVKFKDANTVYAVGTATVRVSSNAGSSWTNSTTSPFGGDLYGLTFNSGHGWACGQNGLILHAAGSVANPIDGADFFVRQHYLDFFSREPDPSGFAFWVDQITSCGADAACTEVRRINVSAAFYVSIEFQETGFLVYRMYKAAYGNIPTTPVPVTFNELVPDTQQIGVGVVVGQTGWEQQLESNKQSFALAFVNRSRFSGAYPTTLTPTQFVDTLFATAGVTPSAADRASAIGEFGSAADTADAAARSRSLRRVAENSLLRQQEQNRAFVLMQYFGYLRRNPNDPPEATLDFQGYQFWLNKLNQFNGNFVEAEMVKAFIVSGEYRQRFGTP